MGFNELKISNNFIRVTITDLIQSFFNSKEFFNNNIIENKDNEILYDLESVESHKQFFSKFPVENALYEVGIKHKFKYKDINIVLSGRLDAYVKEEGILYELKIYERDLEELIYTGLINLFKMQLFIYAFILRKKKKSINRLKLILCSLNQNIIKEFEYHFEYKKIYREIKKLFSFLYDIYIFEISKKKYSNEEILFPYKEIRPIQNEIINTIIDSNKKLTFIEAPFASGKTAAVIYALAKRHNYPVIHFFTSRNFQKKQVYQEGINIGYKPIIRKAFIDNCSLHSFYCKREKCLKYDFPIYQYSILKNNGCPVFYDKLFYNLYDLIIADYNYLLFNALSKDGNIICVIDEYHSFLNRVSEFFSVKIKKIEIENIKKLVHLKYRKLEESFSKLFLTDEFSFNQYSSLNEIDDRYNQKDYKFFHFIDEIKKPLDPAFFDILLKINLDIYSFLRYNNDKDLDDFEKVIYPFYQKLRIIFELSRFDLVISYSKISNEKIFTYKNMKRILDNAFSKYKSIIGISATLEPKQLIYNTHDREQIFIYSKNIPKIIRTYIYANVETIYKKRDKNLYSISSIINKAILNENENNKIIDRAILLFFPSYEFIRLIEVFILNPLYDKIILSKEKLQFTSNTRIYSDEIDEIDKFFIDGKIHLIFLPYRSIIQEGANLNFKIAGGFFIGLPFRVPDNQYLTHSIIMEDNSQNSFEILSLFPALNDVLQSSGRIGRKKEMDNFIYFIGKEYTNEKIFETICDIYKDIKIINN
ncbi:MAG: helicase C-terminal domain-containing protein [Exilispira sp.]